MIINLLLTQIHAFLFAIFHASLFAKKHAFLLSGNTLLIFVGLNYTEVPTGFLVF
jgi:hypothetical protein